MSENTGLRQGKSYQIVAIGSSWIYKVGDVRRRVRAGDSDSDRVSFEGCFYANRSGWSCRAIVKDSGVKGRDRSLSSQTT